MHREDAIRRQTGLLVIFMSRYLIRESGQCFFQINQSSASLSGKRDNVGPGKRTVTKLTPYFFDPHMGVLNKISLGKDHHATSDTQVGKDL